MSRLPPLSPRSAVLILVAVGLAALCVLLSIIVGGLQLNPDAKLPGIGSPGKTRSPLGPTEVSVFGSEQAPTSLFPTAEPVLTTPLPPVQPSNIDIEALLARMSLEEKVGQMILSGVSGKALSEQDRSLLATYYLGGIVYFSGNVQSPGQTLRLSQDLQQLATQAGQGIPLIIAIDHEGGAIHRFKAGLTHFPSPMALGAANVPDLTFQVAETAALELRAVGVNMSLGPVLDINDVAANPVIGLRAFGGYAQIVTSMGVRYIAGLQDSGVIAVAKHFPGHGSTDIDSHSALPVLNKSLDELRSNELMPFVEAVHNRVGVIMVGHIADPQVDPSGQPASLSSRFVQEVLRGELGFDGVVMTDAMTMGAVVGTYDLDRAALMAVQAGCDVLAYTGASYAASAHVTIVQAVGGGTISEERIDESVRRILALKARFGLFDNSVPAGSDIHEQAGLALARQVAVQSIYLQGEASLPLIQSSSLLIVSPDRLPSGSVTGDNLTLLGELLRGRGVQVDEWIYPVDNPAQVAAMQSQVLSSMGSYPQVMVVTWDARLRLLNQNDGSQQSLLNAILAKGVPTIVVAANSPFDLELAPADKPALATFGALPLQIEALVEAMFSTTRPVGVLPIVLK